MTIRTFTAGTALGIVAFVAIVAISALAGCADGYYGPTDSADMQPVDGVLVIENGTGGRIYRSSINFNHLAQEGIQVKVYGTCASACLLSLTHDNICYRPDAKFVFHGASNVDGYDANMSRVIENAFPPKLSAWVKANNAMSDPDRLVTITGKKLATLDKFNRTCRS